MKIFFVLGILIASISAQEKTKGSTALPKDEAAYEIVLALSRSGGLPIIYASDSLKVYQLGIKEHGNKKERIVYLTVLFIFIDKNQKISFVVTRDKITKDRD